MSNIGEAYINILPSTKDFGSSLSSALGGFGKVAAGAMAGATAAVTAFGEKSVEAGMSFDSSMSQVAATMGYTIEELNTEGSEAQKTFQQLSAFAQEMGSTTAFSASESADALNYMALAGYDAETSMKMLPNVLNLAAAGGIDLASASDMVTDAQSALGLTLDETATMVDQMAAASSSSNTSVAQLGEAFLVVGANARTMNGGTEELSTALGILANNGIKGAEGGTHLRNVLLSLQSPTDKGAAALEALGVAVYDAEGNMRSMEDILVDFNAGLEGMTDAEKTDIISTVFNKTDLAAAQALLSGVTEEIEGQGSAWDNLELSIQGANGAAGAMAEVQLDNLSGDLTLFQSALEGFQIVISDQLTPSLREFVQFGSDGLSRLTEAFNTGGLDGAMSELGTIISEGLNQVIEALPEAIDAGASLLGAIGQGLIDNLPQIVDAAATIAGKLVEYLIQSAPQLLQAAITLIAELSQGLAEQLPVLIPAMVDAVLTMVETLIDNIDLLVDSAIILIEALSEGLIAALPELIEKAPEIIIKLVEALVKETPKLIECSLQLMIELAGGLISALPELLAKIPEIVAAIVVGFDDLMDQIKGIGSNLVEGLWNGIGDKVTWITDKIKGFGDTVLNKMKEFFGIASPSKRMRDEVGKWLPEGMAIGIEANADAVTDAMDNLATDTISQGVDISANLSTQSYGSIGSNASNSDLIALLSEYLPIIASGKNVNVSLEGDAGKLFSAMQKQSQIYNNQTGKPAFA